MNIVVVKIYNCEVGSLPVVVEVTHVEGVIFEKCSKDKTFIHLSTSYLLVFVLLKITVRYFSE